MIANITCKCKVTFGIEIEAADVPQAIKCSCCGKEYIVRVSKIDVYEKENVKEIENEKE